MSNDLVPYDGVRVDLFQKRLELRERNGDLRVAGGLTGYHVMAVPFGRPARKTSSS
jgi:hypothetical protein